MLSLVQTVKTAQSVQPVPQLHKLEHLRILALRQTGVLDTGPEPRFDRITSLVSKVLGIKTVVVSLVDVNRQWFKSVCNLDAKQTPRDIAFCAHAINEPSDRLVIPDALKDPRFHVNPLVVGPPHIRCYAGVVLRGLQGLPLGTLCTIDYTPREFSEEFLDILSSFAEMVEYEIARGSWGPDLALVPSAARPPAEKPNWRVINASSFDTVMALRQERSVVAVAIRLPRFDALRRAYGNHIVEQLYGELERRIGLAVKENPFHLERSSEAGFHLCVAVDPRHWADPLDYLQERLIENLGSSFQTSTLTIETPVRIGLSQPAKDSCVTDALLRCSEIALEQITGAQGGPVCKSYDDTMGAKAGRYQALSSSIVAALDNDELSLVLQPKVRLYDNRIDGVEALVRWEHPTLGTVSPAEILQVLDDLDMLSRFDFWVMEKVCTLIRAWSAQHCELTPVAINICGSTFLTPSFPDRALQLLAQSDIKPELIHFEILESAVINDLEQATEQIRRCRDFGFSVALDDFGAGQTSLAYLRKLPVNTVKIDRSFVVDIVENASASKLVFQIISICKSLGKTTVVEGVETVGQYLLLRSFDCDHIQGYYFSKPLPIAETSKLLKPQLAVIEPTGLKGL